MPGAPAPCAPPPALRRGGEEIARAARMAGDMVVCIGYTEDAPGGPYSSAVCVNGDGILGHHRKVHLPAGERAVFRAGSGFAAFDTPIGRIGRLVCYDKTSAEAARQLALDGARLIASLSAWPVCRVDPATLMRRATCRSATSTCSTRRAHSRTSSSGSRPTRSGASPGCALPGRRRSSTRAGARRRRPARGRAARRPVSTRPASPPRRATASPTSTTAGRRPMR